MPATYDSIATQTASGSVATITFSSIPSTYTDLVLITFIGNASGTGAGGIQIRFNGDTASNYSHTYLVGTGSSAVSGRSTSATYFDAGMTNNTTDYSQVIFNIQNYTNATTFKTTLFRGASASTEAAAAVGLWRKTPEAITSIDVIKADGNHKSGSTFTLYGIKAAV